MPNDNDDRSENDDMPTKSNPALTGDCEGKHALSPRAAAAAMARSPIVHVMESAVAVPIDDYKALPVLALDDPDFPGELRAFGVVNGVPMLEWRQCPWNPDVLLAIVPGNAGVLVYHRWDGYGVSDDTLNAEQIRVGMMDLRLTYDGMELLNFNGDLGVFGMTSYEALSIDPRGRSVFSRAVVVGKAPAEGEGVQGQKHAGTDLLYAVLDEVDAPRQPYLPFVNMFTEANYTEVSGWGLSAEQQEALDAYRTNRGVLA